MEKKWMIFFYEPMNKAGSLLLLVYKHAVVREGRVAAGGRPVVWCFTLKSATD